MVCNLSCLTTSTLVYSNVYEYCAWFHLFEIFLLEQLRSRFSWDQNTADYKVSFFHCFFNVSIVRYECLDTCSKDIIKISKSLKVDIHNGYVSAHSYSDLTCVSSYRSTTEDYDVSLWCSRNACKENSFSTESLLKIFSTFLNTQTSCDLAHWCKKRDASVSFDQCLVCNTFYFGIKQSICLRLVCCEVKICIKDKSFVE